MKYNLSLKSLLLFFLLSVAQFSLCQNSKIKNVIYEGVGYYLYPEKQNSKFTSYPSWTEYIIRTKYKLKYDENIDGKWIQFYEDDSTKPAKIFTLKDTKTEGKYIEYYLNGQTKLIENHTQGHENGLSINWYNNGKVQDTVIYKYDLATYYPQVVHKTAFYENGALKKVELYDSNATPNGIWTEYYENGQLKIKQEFSNTVHLKSLLGMHYFGNINGDYHYYYDNGQLRFKLSFKDGEMIDEIFYEYYKNGGKKQYGKLKHGLRDGEWVELYENGNIKSKGSYLSGSYKACGRTSYIEYYEYKTGLWEYYYPSQILLAKGLYENEIIKISNRCDGGVNVNSGKFDKSWIFKNIEGHNLKIKEFNRANVLKNNEIIHQRVYRDGRI